MASRCMIVKLRITSVLLSTARQCKLLTNSLYHKLLSLPTGNNLHVNPRTICAASVDFSLIPREIPTAILRPSRLESSIFFIITARRCDHSIWGQAMASNGLVVDMTSLGHKWRDIIVLWSRMLGHYANVSGQQLWIDAWEKHGVAPVSWTDNLYLTVGGTLSSAGISGSTFRYGPQISNVYEMDVITGPLQFDYSNSSGIRPLFELNPYSWTKIANIIFLDAPVGTGFSYAMTWAAYNINDTSSAAQTYEFLRKWLLAHPKFLTNQLYISGDSYSGVVVPIIVKEIYDGNEAGREPPMNLKGYVLGNPVTCEVKDISQRIPYGYKTALISDELYESTKTDCNGDYMNVDPTNGACLRDLEMVSICLEKINLPQILEPKCSALSPNHTRLKWSRSILKENIIDVISMPQQSKPWCWSYNYLYSYIWANDRNVQEALHIREGMKPEWNRCNKSISYTKDILNSVVYHRYLSKTSLRALIYSGDHDMGISYVGTLDWIRSLNLTLLGPWGPWYVDGQVAGYSILYSENSKYDLTFTTIKGEGHTAPEYKPKECLAMVDRWFSYYPL